MSRAVSSDCAELLEWQSGVVARWQLAGVGCDPASISTLLRSGRWQPIYRGVYASFTGPPSRESLLWAAVLRCGPTAALSHYSAAEVEGLADRRDGPVHVTVAAERETNCAPAESRRSGAPTILVHRSSRAQVARHPVKTPPRTRIEETVIDLTQVARNLDNAVGWISAACGRRLTTTAQLLNALQVRKKVRWRSDLVMILGDVTEGAMSVLEFRYVRDVERPHGLPRAVRQHVVLTGGMRRYLDNLYREFGLAVEVDGLVAHPAEARWREIRRGNALVREGIVALRYGWLDVRGRPCETAREIADVLRSRGWQGQLARCRRCAS
jgi:hypothetical protein